MSNACRKFETPVTGGNVSFYNQTKIDGVETPVFPTPTIGMIGIVPDKNNVMTLNFKNEGDSIFLLGKSVNDINSSEYLANIVGIKESTSPYFELEEEFELQNSTKGLIENKLINAAHDCADGGLFVTLAEMGFVNNMGFDVTTDSELRKDAFLFGEVQSRIVVTVAEDNKEAFIEFMAETETPYSLLGETSGKNVTVDGEDWGSLEGMKTTYNDSLGKHLN
jgi:phosphoribosylformylglycinamidine (FGAM) synthase-like enzyme